MKIKRQSKKLLFIITAAIAVLVIGTVVAYAILTTQTAKNTPQAPSQGKPARELNSVDYSLPEEPRQNNAASDPEPTPPPEPKKLDVIITAASQNQTNLQIRVLVTTLLNSGGCKITLAKQGNATVSATSDVVPVASTSTCDGFDIPLQQLTPGLWKATIEVTSDNISGSTSRDIEVK